MRFFPIILLSLIPALAMSDDNRSVKFDSAGYPDLTQMSEEGFVDLVFVIRKATFDKQGFCTITAEAKHKGQVVGFALKVRPGMKPGIVKNDIDKTAFYGEGVQLLRTGPESDQLLEVLSALYKMKAPARKFREVVPVTTIALQGNPSNLKTEYIKLKIFHDEKDEHEEYFELFLHINMPGNIIALNEKDQEYRPTVLKGLSAK
jgi:hypothetical protein